MTQALRQPERSIRDPRPAGGGRRTGDQTGDRPGEPGGRRAEHGSDRRGAERSHAQAIPIWLDPGWLLIVSGIALIGAALILPAQAELRRAEIEREVAVALRELRQTRLNNYSAFADRLESPDDALLLSLVTTQLNMIPAASEPVATGHDEAMVAATASPFPQLEPVYQPPIVHEPFQTILMKWTAHPTGRLLLLSAGVFMLFIAVLPSTRDR